MSLSQEIANSAMRSSTEFVEVKSGDDLTKSAWRFEKKILEDEHEESLAWKRFALDNNILDPFQIATANDYQYFEPDEEFSHRIRKSNQNIDVDAFDDGSILLFKVYNSLAPDAEILMSEYRMILNHENALANDYFTATFSAGIINIIFNDPNIYIDFSVELVPFRAREMNIPTGQVVTAGDILVAGFYPLRPKL